VLPDADPARDGLTDLAGSDDAFSMAGLLFGA
jgi:hypothetical protein